MKDKPTVMKHNQDHIRFALVIITLFLVQNAFSIKYDVATTTNKITQYQGPVDPSDVNQKVVCLTLNVVNGGGVTPSCSGMVFNLFGSAEVSSIKLMTTNQTSTFTAPITLATVSNPGASVNFTGFTETDNATGLHYYWVVIDMKATLTNDVMVDVQYVSGTYASATPAFPNNNPLGSRRTTRNYRIGTGEHYSTMKMAADSIAEFDYDGAADIFMELTANYANPLESGNTILFSNHTGPANIIFRPAA
jgi:hypothetical protein